MWTREPLTCLLLHDVEDQGHGLPGGCRAEDAGHRVAGPRPEVDQLQSCRSTRHRARAGGGSQYRCHVYSMASGSPRSNASANPTDRRCGEVATRSRTAAPEQNVAIAVAVSVRSSALPRAITTPRW